MSRIATLRMDEGMQCLEWTYRFSTSGTVSKGNDEYNGHEDVGQDVDSLERSRNPGSFFIREVLLLLFGDDGGGDAGALITAFLWATCTASAPMKEV